MNKVKITEAGLAALPNDNHDGTAATRIVAVALGNGTAELTAKSQALTSEHRRLSTIAGEAVGNHMLHLTILDESEAAYTVTEFSAILDDGTFFCVYSQADPIIEKSSASTLLESIDIALIDADVSSLTFPSLAFSNPHWSEDVKGVAKRSTKFMAEVGEDNETGSTPLRVFQAIAKWLGKTSPASTYPISVTGRAAAADESDHASSADQASNAAMLGGKPPREYRDASKLNPDIEAPASVVPLAGARTRGAVERRFIGYANRNNPGYVLLCYIYGDAGPGDRYLVTISGNSRYQSDEAIADVGLAYVPLELRNDDTVGGCAFMLSGVGNYPFEDVLASPKNNGGWEIWAKVGAFTRFSVQVFGTGPYEIGDNRISDSPNASPLPKRIVSGGNQPSSISFSNNRIYGITTGGLVVQGRELTLPADQSYTYQGFAQPFPNACISVTAIIKTDGSRDPDDDVIIQAGSSDKNGVYLRARLINGNLSFKNRRVYMTAVGY